MQNHLKSIFLPLFVTAFVGVSGCSGERAADIFDKEKYDLHDKRQGLSREDYRQMTRPETDVLAPQFDGPPQTKVELGEPPVPDISQILAAPRPPELGQSQLVTMFVTDEVPIKDVLIELARQADVDVEIDGGIQGGVFFRAQNRPFNEVVERISSLAGLRYTMKDGVLRFERDTAFVQTYPLHFLSFDRSATSDMNVTTSVLSAGGAGGGSGALNSGSTAAITYATESDFWSNMSAALEQILGFRKQNGMTQAQGEFGAAAQGGGNAEDETFFTVNRQAATLTVSGSSYHHDLIQDYLRKMEEMTSSQVLIEAKIVEVTLDERFQSGINWNQVFSSDYLTLDAAYSQLEDVAVGQNLTQILLGGSSADDPSLDALVSLTERFGTTRTLSSPRVHAMNNQQAVVTFATNVLYFDISVEREEDDTVSGTEETLTFESERITVPVGIILSLQPSINPKTQEITLSVRPTISQVTEFKTDPVIPLILAQLDNPNAVAGLTSQIPEIEVRELDSMVRMKSGQVMVLGGLMEQRGDNQEEGVPFLSGVPWIGNAFKGVSRGNETTELYFLIKATIVGNETTVGPADRTMYKKFTDDHRPLAF